MSLAKILTPTDLKVSKVPNSMTPLALLTEPAQILPFHGLPRTQVECPDRDSDPQIAQLSAVMTKWHQGKIDSTHFARGNCKT